MATSAHKHRRAPAGRPLVGFVVGKYFAMHPNKTPDFNGIDRNIEEAVSWAIKLWDEGFLAVTPHLNTHHFEQKTVIDPHPLENEEYFRAFDRKLLMKGIDFVFATPNWRQSTGGRLEIQLACYLKIPVFESIAEVHAWAAQGKSYSTVHYHDISEEAKTFGEGKDVPIIVVDGPYWSENGVEPNVPAIRRHARHAEQAAITLFNNKIGAFSPHLNASYERLGRVPREKYQALCDRMLENVADAVYLISDWEQDPESRRRVHLAHEAGVPVFNSLNEIMNWRAGKKFCVVSIQDPEP